LLNRVSHEELMRYLDGEASPDEKAHVERALETSTELRRELIVYKAMKDDLLTLKLATGDGQGRHSVWHAVSRQLGRPLAWALVIVGSLVWAVHGLYVYMTSPIFLWEKLATSAITIGILILLATVIWERYRTSLSDPYRDVQR
jgi:anti-sigma factor RsiW